MSHKSLLADALSEIRRLKGELDAAHRGASQREPVAVVGAGCRLPGGAYGLDGLWRLLSQGVDAVGEVPAERFDVGSLFDADPDARGKTYSRWGAFLDSVEGFDPLFFGIAPREAVGLDPQQRLLLEVSWEALEDTGLAAESLVGSRTGVFAGVCFDDYSQRAFNSGDLTRIDPYNALGSTRSIAVGRVAYVLGLQGPVMQLDTTCSSSLLAVHLACRSLQQGESDLALAGGVSVMLSPAPLVSFSRLKALSPSGRSRTFDASADGYVRGEGCGIVVLKRLSEARRDGDRILAVIRGSAVNHDGRSNGLTAPSGAAQEEVIRAALDDADLSPAEVGFVETHGTGTSLGDPIEVQALGRALCEGREEPLWLGALKTNMGHLEAAAGVAGLLKAALVVEKGEIPPNLHFKEPNPYIPWDRLPVRVPTEPTPFPAIAGPRRAGVSSFGMSGTNVHVILEQPPEEERVEVPESSRPLHLLGLSARSPEALTALAGRYAEHLESAPQTRLADLTFNAWTTRNHFEHRLALVASGGEEEGRKELLEQLREAARGEAPGVRGRTGSAREGEPVFLYTGQGAQMPGMGRGLYEVEPVFRRVLEDCAEVLEPLLDEPLLEVLYPREGAPSPLGETAYTQPALFALGAALTELWRSWGVHPAAVMGHSVGEYVAAWAAGVLSLEDGLRLLAERGRLMQALPRDGEMLAVFASEDRLRPCLEERSQDLSIASLNGPEGTVVSGRRQAVEELATELAAEGVKSRALKVSHAFHSPLMDPILDPFERLAEGVELAPAHLPLISNLSGEMAGDEVTTAAYWRRHVRQSVRFAQGMETLAAQGFSTFVEIGPRPTLLGMGRRCLPEGSAAWLPSLRPGTEDLRRMGETLAELWVQGAEVDWVAFSGGRRRRVALPTYPFQRERYWLEAVDGESLRGLASHPLLGRRLPALAHRPDLHVWQLDLDRRHLPFINDHVIQGAVVVPGVVYVELALNAAREAYGPGTYALCEVEYSKVLFVPAEGSQTVQISLSGSLDEGVSFEIHSRSGGRPDEAWTRHAAGRLAAAELAQTG